MRRNLSDRFLAALDGRSHAQVVATLRRNSLEIPAPLRREAGQMDIWERDGFGVRISTRSARATITFQVTYRLAGKKPRVALGRYPALGLAAARKAALAYREEARQGIDPRLRREDERRERRSEEARTFEKLAADFVIEYARPKNRTWLETARLIGLVPDPKRKVDADGQPVPAERRFIIKKGTAVAKWRSRPIASIGRRDVADHLKAVEIKSGPYASNRTLAALRKMFNWAALQGELEATPVVPGMARGKETARDRVLSRDEFGAVWGATEAMAYPWGAFVRCLMLTCARRGEVAKMRWSAINFDERTWTLTPEETKNRRPHVVPLTGLMQQILDDCPRLEGCDWVFSTTFSKPITPGTLLKAELDERSGTSGWRLHDLRRTGATLLAEHGIGHDLIKRILNHTDRDVTLIYNRFHYLPEKRAALELLGRVITGKEAPPLEAEIVQLEALR